MQKKGQITEASKKRDDVGEMNNVPPEHLNI